MGVTLTVEGIDQLQAAFDKLPLTIMAGVKVGEPGVEYALFWEFGKISIRPGPKTLYSTNALGQRVVLTKQAPHGYIRTNKKQFQEIINSEVSKVKLSTTKMDGWQSAIEKAADKAAQQCTDLIREAAPVDTGDLRNSIEPAFSGDSILSNGGAQDPYYGESSFDLGSFDYG
jgi:hypothetical protein